MNDQCMQSDELEPVLRGLAVEFGFRGGPEAPLDEVVDHLRELLERDSRTQWALEQGGR